MKISDLLRFGRGGYSIDERERRRSSRSEGVRDILFVSGLIMLFFVAFLGLTFVLQPMLGLNAAEQDRERARQELAETLAEEKRQHDIYAAMETDAELNEAMARDNGFARPNEKVIRIPAQPATTTQQPPAPAYRD